MIIDDVDGLLTEMSSWLSKGDSRSVHLRPHMLRLIVRLALFFRRVSRSSYDDITGSILEPYFQKLVRLGRTYLAAGYVGQLLLADDQIRLYAQCLVLVVKQQAESRPLLLLAYEVGMDVNAMQVVISLCHQGDNIQSVGDASLQVINKFIYLSLLLIQFINSFIF